MPFVQAERIRVLAVTTAKRSSYNPEWRTLQEQGVPEVDASNWVGMFAPKGVPQPFMEQLNGEIQKILFAPNVRERFAAGGAETTPMSMAAFDTRVKSDIVRFRKILAEARISVE